ncbi:MAG: hypothetical protein HQ481_16170 [Alphaproteobacteria bacterium]|nr:hypothetical protein [Alphaproteobacteria bacterium]
MDGDSITLAQAERLGYVRVVCRSCYHKAVIPTKLLLQRYGPDKRLSGLAFNLRCTMCRRFKPDIDIRLRFSYVHGHGR